MSAKWRNYMAVGLNTFNNDSTWHPRHIGWTPIFLMRSLGEGCCKWSSLISPFGTSSGAHRILQSNQQRRTIWFQPSAPFGLSIDALGGMSVLGQ